MAKGKSKGKSNNSSGRGPARGTARRAPVPPPTAQAALSADQSAVVHPASFALGLLGGLAALGFAAALSVQSIAGTTLPGCGPKSACGAATSSVYGKLPVLGWPVSHLGTAFFFGIVLLWIMSRQRLGGLASWIIRLGALVSFGYILIIAFNSSMRCPYCLAAHAGNFLLLGAAEWRRIATARVVRIAGGVAEPKPVPNRPSLIAWAGGFAAATAALGIASVTVQKNFEADQEIERLASEAQIAQQIAQQRAEAERRQAQPSTPSESTPTDPSQPAGPGQSVLAPGSYYGEHNPFVGRYTYGPEKAAVRIVVFSDFQCPDCKRIDTEIRQLKAQYSDRIALSFKHFPFNSECNPHAQRTLHGNACWAARVAEIAGHLGGSEAFYKMHDWLYDVEGKFETNEALQVGVARAGLNWNEFSAALRDPALMAQINADIAADCSEAVALGLNMTPMIFVNGVEMRGIRSRNAMTNTVLAALNQNPPVLGWGVDEPILADEKAVELLLANPARALPASDMAVPLGADDAPITVQIWGSLGREDFRLALAEVRKAADRRGDLRIILRHYPLDPACNPNMQGSTEVVYECEMARMLDAVGIVSGKDAYWSLVDWLMVNADRYSRDGAMAHLRSLGLDTGAVTAAMNDPARAASIMKDIQALRSNMSVQGVPAIFINGRHAVQWRGVGRAPVIDRLIDAVGGE